MSENGERLKLLKRISELRGNQQDFEPLALDIFRYQVVRNPIFRKYLALIKYDRKPMSLSNLVFMPISFFKHHNLKSGHWTSEKHFTSSGTTGTMQSRHAVRDNENYLANCKRCFEEIYGPLDEYVFLALLPGYLEREGSSLIEMMDYFISCSEAEESDFYLHDYDKLAKTLAELVKKNRKVVLIGVSYALMDFADHSPMNLSSVIVMETGGMKGKRAELTKEKLHDYLNQRLNTNVIHSEYGMTELFSQAYSVGNGIFQRSAAMQVVISELNDPFAYRTDHRSGRVNVIDLANIDTCSFLATDDLGIKISDTQFRIEGRIDHSDLRGCNLLLEEINNG